MTTTRMLSASFLALAVTLGATACGGSEAPGEPGTSNSNDASNQGDNLIVEPLKAVGATKVEIGPDAVRAHFGGSAEDATAWTYCSAVQALIGQKAAILVYADGELNCADRDAD